MGRLRVPRTSQPQGAGSSRIDWSHPLTRGLVSAWSGAGNGLLITRAGVFKKQPDAPVASKITRYGESTGALATSLTQITLPAGSFVSTISGTRFALMRVNSATSQCISASSATSGNLAFRVNNGDLQTVSVGVAVQLNVAAAVTNGELCAVAASVDQASLTHKIYKNGVLLGSNSSGGISTAAGTPQILANGASTQQGDHGIALHLAYDRALSDAEIKSLSDNPWQIFAPIARNIWVPTAAAGGAYTLTADTANIAIAGAATTLTYVGNKTLTADAGTVPIAGAAANLAFNRVLTADTANTPIAGAVANLAFNRSLAANAGAVPIAGAAIGLAFNRTLTADTANVPISGAAATLTYTAIGGPTYTLPADLGAVAITGNATGLAFNRTLTADTTNLPIAGTATGLARGYTLAASAGAVPISASDAALIATRKMLADAYAAVIAGADATLTYSPLSLPTIGRPTSDTSNTGWTPSTGVDLYAMVDEVTPSAVDYISASSVGAICKMALNATAYPGTASQNLKYRASSSTGNSVIVRLKEGATTIRTETQALTAVDTEYTLTLTSGEIAAITSGSLSVELESA